MNIHGHWMLVGNLSTRRSWLTNGMAGRTELDRGRGFACQMQIIKQNDVKPSRTPTEQFSWKCLSKTCVKFCFFLTKKTWFQTKNFYFCMTNTLRRTQNLNLWFQPENSRFEAGQGPQLRNVLTCAVAVTLQKYFRLASVVPRASGA